jgi:hypothetical protein
MLIKHSDPNFRMLSALQGGYNVELGLMFSSMLPSFGAWWGDSPGNWPADEWSPTISRSTGKVSANPNPPFDPQTYDYSQPPGPDFEWRGPEDKGSWFNPRTNEYVRRDFLTVGHDPHYDWRAPNGSIYRVYLDGTVELKGN